MNVVLDSEACVGHGRCYALAPEVYDADDEGHCQMRFGPDAVDGGAWNRLYVFQRYTSIGAGTTEVQKNIIADRAIKMPRQ